VDVDATELEEALSKLRRGLRFACGALYRERAEEIFEAALAEGLDVVMLANDGMYFEVVPSSPEERGTYSWW